MELSWETVPQCRTGIIKQPVTEAWLCVWHNGSVSVSRAEATAIDAGTKLT